MKRWVVWFGWVAATGCASKPFPPVRAIAVPAGVDAPTGLVVLGREREAMLRNEDGAEIVLVERVRAVVVDPERANPVYRSLRFESGRSGRVQEVLARHTPRVGEPRVHRSAGSAIALDALETDDVLDWRVTYVSRDPEVFPVVVATGPEPAVRVTLRAVVESEFRAAVRFGERAVIHARHEGSGVFVREFRDVPAHESGEFALHPQRVGPWMLIVAQKGESGRTLVDYASSWAQVARRVQGRAATTAALSDEAKAELGRGGARLRLNAVRRLLRPASATLFASPARRFEALVPGSATPFEAAKVIAAASGDAVETTRVALVAAAGGPMVFDDLPGLYGFEDALVAFELNGAWSFAAPACTNCDFGRVPVAMAGARAFVADPEKPVLLSIPLEDVDIASAQTQLTWEPGSDGQLIGSGLVELDGELARWVFERSKSLASPQSVADALRHIVIAGATITEVEERGVLRPGESLPFALKLQSRATVDAVSLERLVGPALPWFPELRAGRALRLPAPIREESVHTIQLRSHGEVLLPRPVRFSSGLGTVEVSFEQSGRLLTVRRVVEWNEARITPELHAAARTLLDAARSADRIRWQLEL